MGEHMKLIGSEASHNGYRGECWCQRTSSDDAWPCRAAVIATNAPLTVSEGAQDRTTEPGTEEALRGAEGVGHE